MDNRHELLPDPIRMVEGLRDTGYQLNTAVADVIDNSITAEASFVDIRVNLDHKNNISIQFFDDGIGMDYDALINAMKYGSKPRPSPSSLGKFGLGLKTASTAFCRRLSVVSRNNQTAPLIEATWDIDHIKETNKWELLVNTASDSDKAEFENVIGERSGTLVIWRKVDRLLKNHYATKGLMAKKALDHIVDNLRDHLGMVFQRFLDPEDSRARTIKMKLNGIEIEAWDPFCIGNSEVVNETSINVELTDGSMATFTMKAYVLPRKEEFVTDVAAKKARINNANQGIYIYRENRLIHGPDWLRMFTKEPHFSLLRAEFSFDYQLDEAFQIDIKKSQIILNEALNECIVDFLVPPRRAAEVVYRKGRQVKTGEIANTAHDSSNRNIGSKVDEIHKPSLGNVDQEKGEVVLSNQNGTVSLKLKITSAAKQMQVYVQPVDGIDDGLLWEPCLIDRQYGVRINTNHPYYTKVYLPNISEGVTVQGMDALLWGISVAELNCVSEETKSSFGELRYEVSRTLRKLVQDLPEASEEP